jgi:SAM-dependent methyltransferase
MSEAKSLLLACGNARGKYVHLDAQPEWTGKLVTCDMNPNCGADVVWDLTKRPLPFQDEEFDEIGCYNAMEHWGHQGDWRDWFDEMAEYHRMLKWGGLFSCLVPIGQDALADPGHTRFIHPNYFGFLSQKFYVENLNKGACVTDYRWHWKLNFTVVYMSTQGNHHLGIILRKEKYEAA